MNIFPYENSRKISKNDMALFCNLFPRGHLIKTTCHNRSSTLNLSLKPSESVKKTPS